MLRGCWARQSEMRTYARSDCPKHLQNCQSAINSACSHVIRQLAQRPQIVLHGCWARGNAAEQHLRVPQKRFRAILLQRVHQVAIFSSPGRPNDLRARPNDSRAQSGLRCCVAERTGALWCNSVCVCLHEAMPGRSQGSAHGPETNSEAVICAPRGISCLLGSGPRV